ncbi:transcription elongation factor GreA/GreB C-terminal domain protein [Leptospira inadai serovar Lyme str. 10]|uniref:Transcription elongation factor GreA n=2 Tax=Leptospira inadai serovar Lyme TaxID=293084 RepID=V6HZZ2_9LEPT|nr:transcription elongation factor GreA [Leptospira inadai]EQA38584.1 transcription elongation factor GreA/GreB C-terminal domain protein [Leptospira inadai serovar Lyme str. 10]PNV75237.1 transcription elongation factor GreA [Leptospira inadai serovar Lyme]
MSNETATTAETKPASDLDKLTSLFNEEIYVRSDANSIPASKFKIYDDLIESFGASGVTDAAKAKLEEHLAEHPESISARYLLGILGLQKGSIDAASYFKNLLDAFKQAGKWTIIEHITDNILKYGEDRYALRFKAEALEKLKKNKELKPVLEKLAKQDRKNPEIAKKYGLAILEENRERAITYLKQAIETFAKTKDYVQFEEIWPIFVSNNYDDIQFVEKIERILLGHREKTRLAGYLYPLVDPHKAVEDWDRVIYLLKKILDHEPVSNKARNELIRVYKLKYANHSLLEDFLKMSELGNNRKPVKVCISNFERNIVFDTDNYVLHRNWGVGKIVSISPNGDSIFVDFKDKKNHKLSIQMAITSLKPLKVDHIWVKFYENKESVVELFEKDIPSFFKELLTSFDGHMLVAEIKNEVVGKFLPVAEWSKWWNKAKNIIKKEPKLGFNPKKKDELWYREKPITFAEELTEKFSATSDLSKKLDIAIEALRNKEEAEGAIDTFAHHYYEEEESNEPFRRIVAFLYLEEVASTMEGEDGTPYDFQRHQKEDQVAQLIKTLTREELLEISSRITNLDIKKSFVDLVKKFHKDWVNVLVGLLFEVPVKNNKYVVSVLEDDKKFAELNLFIETAASRAKENPEVFLWVAKSILWRTWDEEWMNVSRQDLILRVLRLLKPLNKIEEKGTKLKNTCHEILFGNESAVITEAIQNGDSEYIRKVYALYREVPYIEETDKDKLMSLIQSLKPDLVWEEEEEDDEEDDVLSHIPENAVLVTRWALNQKKADFEHLVNVEMLENSRDIGEAQERGDLRENAEYKAAMERQVQLQAQIKKLESELKTAVVLDLSNVKTDRINIGTTVKLKNESTGENQTYSILGAWDADTEKNIISYQSPLAKSLLGKRVGDTAALNLGGAETKFKVLDINRFSLQNQES